jgi:hypothetical protein
MWVHKVKEDESMLDMFETALDMEVERRREVLLATMRAARGVKPAGRHVPGVARARHVWAAIATAR